MASRSYQRIERERRFLLAGPPPGLDLASFHWVVTDRYLEGQRLRLRAMVASNGEEELFKLGQKYRPPNSPDHQRGMTTLYLSASEFAYLAERLTDGLLLVKHRYRYEHEGVGFAIDVFQGPLGGLILGDLEVDDDVALLEQPVPAWAIAEVTNDSRYEGGELARRNVAPAR